MSHADEAAKALKSIKMNVYAVVQAATQDEKRAILGFLVDYFDITLKE